MTAPPFAAGRNQWHPGFAARPDACSPPAHLALRHLSPCARTVLGGAAHFGYDRQGTMPSCGRREASFRNGRRRRVRRQRAGATLREARGTVWHRVLKYAWVVLAVIVATDLILAQAGKRVIPEWRDRILEERARIAQPPFNHGMAPPLPSSATAGATRGRPTSPTRSGFATRRRATCRCGPAPRGSC